MAMKLSSTNSYNLPRLATNEHGALIAIGTVENPGVSRKRRRTTPEEFAVLEAEFKKDSLPSLAERTRIAKLVNMSGRAVQVWFQNRRQKEKREANTYRPPTSDSSPDPDRDARDHDGMSFAFSSSPLPSPVLPVPPPAATAAMRQPSYFAALQLVDKENRAAAALGNARASLPPEVQCVMQTQIVNSNGPAFVHRPATTSRIAAKKHVKKRPLGSHAPLARMPSLGHSFDFPPSPPPRSPLSLDGSFPPRPVLQRQGSSASTTSTTSGINFDLSLDGRARVMPNFGEVVVKVESPTEEMPPESSSKDVWTHMATSPPASSPVNSPEKLDQFQHPARKSDAIRKASLGGHSNAAKDSIEGEPRPEASRAGHRDTDAQAAIHRKKRVMDRPATEQSEQPQRQASASSSASSKRRRTSEPQSVQDYESDDSDQVPELDRSFSDSVNSSFESVHDVSTPPTSSSARSGGVAARFAKAALRDDERECAELLLGLGGYVTRSNTTTRVKA